MEDIRAVILGAGAAGVAISKLLLEQGIGDVILCDRKGIISQGREGLDWSKEAMSKITNKGNIKGSAAEAFKGADVFIGVSGPDTVTPDMIRSMNKNPIVFAMSNPVPEIDPILAKEAGAVIIGTGRSDYPNQINNVLAFPGIFRGTMDVRAKKISTGMKLAAAHALAALVSAEELSTDYIIPKPFDKRVGKTVAAAVSAQAIKEGLNRI